MLMLLLLLLLLLLCVCSAGRLQAKFVIHTVGPVYKNAEESAPLLRRAYQ
jgi:O-acetyl-ADP-ribose deacetylase (regulator of RNase III)